MRQLESPALAPAVRELLAPLVTLFAAAAVERELAWFVCQELVPAKVGGTQAELWCGGDASRPEPDPPRPPSALPTWTQVARLVPDYVRSLVASIAPHTQQVVASFGIPDELVAAPIAANWERYNTYDNQGELPGSPFSAGPGQL